MSWDVHVKDAAGAPVVDATVSLIAGADLTAYPFGSLAATHVHAARGIYTVLPGNAPTAAGTWLLVVRGSPSRTPALSTVVQPVQIEPSTPALGYRVRAVLREAASVVLSGYATSPGPSHPGAAFQVTMYPVSYALFVAGNHSQTNERALGSDKVPTQVAYRRSILFRPFAQSYGAGAVSRATLDEGTHLVVMSLASSDRWTRIFVKARGVATDWLMIGEKYAAGNISVLAAYSFLNSTANRTPHAVREVSFFSHAFIEGPILRNTYDTKAIHERARDGSDLDGRSKDFDPPNITGYPDMPNAMASPSSFHVWGCNKNVRVVRMAAMSNVRQSALDTFFLADSVEVSGTRFEENTTPRIVRREIFKQLRTSSYAARAALTLPNATVWGSAPGSWARVNQDQFWVPWTDPSTGDLPSFQALDTWYKRELGTQFVRSSGLDGGGYLSFSRLAATNIPTVTPSSRYYLLKRKPNTGIGLEFFEFPMVIPIPPGISDAARGALLVTTEPVTNAAAMATGASPPVKPGEVGTLYRILDVATTVAAYLVVEDTDPNNGNAVLGVRVFSMNIAGGNPAGVHEEERPQHRVELVTTGTVSIGGSVTVRYWGLSGDSAPSDVIALARVGSPNHETGRIATPPTRVAGEAVISTIGMPPGEYLARVFDGGPGLGIKMGESNNRVTLVP
jgi:hypothetical protein